MVQLKYLFFIVFALLTCVLPIVGQQKQKFSIESFEYEPFDMTAQDAKFDGSGDRYAIIKVTSTNPDDDLREYTFNFGNLRSFVEEHDNELWVYVQKNAKIVTIGRSGYVTIQRYDLRTTIESAKTYSMKLSSEDPIFYTQMVRFTVEPINSSAVITVKSSKSGSQEEIVGTIDATGSVAKSMEFGTYTYKVMASNYHTSEGRFTLNDKVNTHLENIVLRPNFSNITLKVNSEAEIYVNNEKKGVRAWTGILKAGNYHVECRQANHKNSILNVTIVENDNRTIELPTPIPITGILAITSNPLDADIIIDGNNFGKTPQNINDLVVGKHTVTLSKQNYKSVSQEVEIIENQTSKVELTLNDFAKMTISSKPVGATLFIDGKNIGFTPCTKEMASGDYDVRLICKKYREYRKKIHLDSSNPDILITLKRQYLRENGFYAQASGQIGYCLGITGNIGGYFKNINVEAFITSSLQKETIWLNSTNGTFTQNDDVSALFWGAKIGYGIIVGGRSRITPQIGVGRFQITGDYEASENTCFTIGARLEYAIANNFGVSITPEIQFLIQEDENFESLKDISSRIKNWGSGANVRIGFYAYI